VTQTQKQKQPQTLTKIPDPPNVPLQHHLPHPPSLPAQPHGSVDTVCARFPVR
jgi:hypothetical protein